MAQVHSIGNSSTDIKEENISRMVSVREGANLLNSSGERPSGPHAALFFSFFIACVTLRKINETFSMKASSGTQQRTGW